MLLRRDANVRTGPPVSTFRVRSPSRHPFFLQELQSAARVSPPGPRLCKPTGPDGVSGRLLFYRYGQLKRSIANGRHSARDVSPVVLDAYLPQTGLARRP